MELLIDSAASGAALTPHRSLGAALNMAVDEVLLRHAERPILRVYGWARPAVTFGYFEEWAKVSAAYPQPAWELVRRWTGGGVVPHGKDWTYSVIVPRSEEFAGLNAGESYRILHELLAGALSHGAAGGLENRSVAVTPAAAVKVSQACFENPAQYDLLVAGHKIAGAAQRRSRFGLLHQGSIQGIAVESDFAGQLAQTLAHTVTSARCLSRDELEEAEALAMAKYATPEWNRKY